MPGYVLVESIGALVIGAWMLLQPTCFNAVILIALGIILLLAGISQIISLIRSGQIMPIPIGMYIVPVLITIAGFLMIFKPFGTVNLISDITLFYLLSVPPLFLLPKNRLFQIAPRYCTTKSIC